MRLFAFATVLALAAPAAHADTVYPSFDTSINGGALSPPPFGYVYIKSPTGSYTYFESDQNGYGVSFRYIADPYPFLQGPIITQPVKTVELSTNSGTYFVTDIKLDPSSTITGIVPSVSTTFNYNGYLNTKIDFDFTNASIDVFNYGQGTATFDFTLTPAFSTPEIDPSLGTSGLLLLAGSITILRTRRLRQPAKAIRLAANRSAA